MIASFIYPADLAQNKFEKSFTAIIELQKQEKTV
tara:strand:+ start:2576 stop:2677 length:102 start_codon:yes stop_codon:yes gene_type:complete